MCLARTEMSCNAKKKCIHLSKCMIKGSLLVCEAMMLTTAMLSHHTSTWRCCHCAPRMAHAKAIGSSSLAAMHCWSQLPFHSICIHLSFHAAPQPHDSDASELNVISGCPRGLCTSNMLRLFYNGRKVSHHSKSDRNSAVKWIQWSSCRALCAVSIILLKKVRTCLTTLHA